MSHPVSCCQLGLGDRMLQPLTEPLHAVSVKPRVLLAVESDVPPTAVTFSDDDGNSTPMPYPTSPVLATTAIAG
jgi:hypothetical protein